MPPRSGDERRDYRFVLRLWREPSAGRSVWRGSVYDVSNAFGIVSGRFGDLWDFITLRVGRLFDERAAGELSEDEENGLSCRALHHPADDRFTCDCSDNRS